jgi:hypothetical protein
MTTRPTPPTGAAPRTLTLNPKDNVLIAVDAVPQGLEVRGVTATQRIPKDRFCCRSGLSA